MQSTLFAKIKLFRGLTTCLRRESTYQGLSLEDSIKIRSENLSPAYITYYKNPLMIHKGERQYVWDTSGKKYLDFFGGIVTVSVGHCHPKVNAAVIAQMQKLWHTTCIYLTPPMQEYAQLLIDKFPGHLKVCFFTNSGSEANEMAVLLARLYTSRTDILCLRNSYHGMTGVIMGLTNLSNWKFPLPTNTGFEKCVNPDPYRGPWGGKFCRDCTVQTDRSCNCQPGNCHAKESYVAQVEDVLNYCVPQAGIAGFIAESIQGVGGVVQYPKGYLEDVYKLVRSRGGVTIADEVQTGFGRTGEHFWGFQMHNVIPDIVVMAKGIGNGFPLGAVVTTPEIAASMKQAAFFNTYSGNPLACTVGKTVLEVIEEEKLQENCTTLGTYFLNQLALLKSKSSIIGDVRGKGLMLGIELVEDKDSRKPLALSKTADLFEKTKDLGILLGKGGRYGNVLRISPPMCITKQDVDTALDVLDRVLC